MSVLPQGADALPKWPFGIAILAIWLVGFLPIETGPIWIPAAQIHYHVSAVTMGGIASMQFTAAAIAANFLAPRIGKMPLRVPMLVVMAGSLASAVSTAVLVPAFPVFVALRAADGVTSGLCVACAAILANRTARPSRSFGVMQFGQIICNMLIFAISTRIVVAYGITGLYGLVAVGMAVLIVPVLLHQGWGVAIVPRAALRGAAPAKPSARILIGSFAIALVYAGFVGMVTNASALGHRAGLDFQQVTEVLALTTPVGGLGALIATFFAGRVSGAALVAAGVIGTAAFGLCLTFGGTSFAALTVTMCGTIMFMYVGFPSLYAGIARLDATGRSSATAQAAQLLGPVFGPAIGAIIAVHSVIGLGLAITLAIAGGIGLACATVWPALTRELAPAPSEALSSLPNVV